jgi:hypothetical protein
LGGPEGVCASPALTTKNVRAILTAAQSTFFVFMRSSMLIRLSSYILGSHEFFDHRLSVNRQIFSVNGER